MTGGEIAEGQGMRGRLMRQDEEQLWLNMQQVQIQRGAAGWRYQEQECRVRNRMEVAEGSARDRRQRAGTEGVLGVQMQKMEYEEVPEGTGKDEWSRRQEGGVDLLMTGGREAVLQLQHREDLRTGWGAKRAVQLHSGHAVWMEPGLKGRYRVAAGGAAVVYTQRFSEGKGGQRVRTPWS